MTDACPTLGLGIIEGFFGPPWSWDNRRHYAGFLKRTGFSFYIFAPKRCDDLRLQWTRPWAAPEWAELARLRRVYAGAGIKFGVGLSPYALYRGLSPENEAALISKVEQLDRLELDILGVFFDDMPEGGPDLARVQAGIMSRVREASRAKTFVLCPTFYSDDPVLTRLSGPMPEGYLTTLGERLERDVHVFWTGPKVCSAHISGDHIRDITERLGRAPMLWDNYPVNDGARMSQFLHLRAFEGRDDLPQCTLSGHAVNPMNQARLSEIPIRSLSCLYRGLRRLRSGDGIRGDRRRALRRGGGRGITRRSRRFSGPRFGRTFRPREERAARALCQPRRTVRPRGCRLAGWRLRADTARPGGVWHGVIG